MVFCGEMNMSFDLEVAPKNSLQQDAKVHICNILDNLRIRSIIEGYLINFSIHLPEIMLV